MSIKVTHVSTSDRGGAFNSALRLHQGLLNENITSKYLCLDRLNQNSIDEIYQHERYYPKLYERVFNKIGLPLTAAHKNLKKIRRKEGKYEIFSFPNTDYSLHLHPLVKEANIINLHWVANFLDFPSFFANTKQPVVWTLHDMNPFQGGFHYQDDVKNNTNYSGLENKLRRVKKDALARVTNLHIVTPSKWLFRESQNSELLGRFPHHHIPYGLDTNLFKPFPKSLARSLFNIPADKLVLLFACESLENPRKGLDLLIEAIKHLPTDVDCHICAVGTRTNIPDDLKINQLGRIQDDRLMPLLFSAADAFILPSREDNLPNVMLESLACGTPVICFPVGGMPDVIENGFNGVIANDIGAIELKDAILSYIKHKDKFDNNKIRNFATENYSLSVQAQKYEKLYSDLSNL